MTIHPDAIRQFFENRKLRKLLTYRELKTMELRYGFSGDGMCYSLQEIGYIFKTTRERVRSIEKQFLKKVSAYFQDQVAP